VEVGLLRTNCIIMFLVCTICAPLAAQTPPGTSIDMQKPITVDQALEIAFCQSPDIRVALDQIQKSKGFIAEARANFMPKFNASANQQWNSPAVTINAPGLGTFDVVTPQNTATNASVLLPLDINNRLGFTARIARYQNQIDYLNLRGVSQKLIYDVKYAYYQLLRARGQEDVAQAALDVANARLRETNAKFLAGTAPKFDVTNSQVQAANFNQELITAKSRVAIARSALNRVLGINVNAPTEIVKSEVPVENIKVDIPASVEQAQTQRPEILSTQTAIELNRTNTKLQRSAAMPTMAGSGVVTYNVTASGFTSQNTSFLGLLELKIPIWDGGVTSAKVAQAFADVNKSIDQLDQVKLGIGLEVRTASLNLQEAIERVSTTTEGVALGEESLRLANVRYAAGISTIVEVTDAERSLNQARFFAVQAKYDYIIALADLQRATSTQPEIQKLQLLSPQPR